MKTKSPREEREIKEGSTTESKGNEVYVGSSLLNRKYRSPVSLTELNIDI